MKFRGMSEGQEFEANIEFYKPIDSKKSKYKIYARCVKFHLMKKEVASEEEKKIDGNGMKFWPRLLKDKLLEKNEVRDE